jgi:hypothetical protein
MIFVVVNGTFICTSYGEWWSTGITCEPIVIYCDLCDVCEPIVIYCDLCDVCDMYVMFVIYISCQWCLLCIFFVCLDGTDKTIKKIFHVTLPSVLAITLGKGLDWTPGESGLPSVNARTLGKPDGFAECQCQDTRQTWWLCRVSRLGH